MVTKLENTLKSVMFSGHDCMFKYPGGRTGKHMNTNDFSHMWVRTALAWKGKAVPAWGRKINKENYRLTDAAHHHILKKREGELVLISEVRTVHSLHKLFCAAHTSREGSSPRPWLSTGLRCLVKHRGNSTSAARLRLPISVFRNGK